MPMGAGAGAALVVGLVGLTWAQPEDEAVKNEAAAMAQRNRLRPEHKQLAELCGVFDVTLTIWPQPGMEPMTITGGSATR